MNADKLDPFQQTLWWECQANRCFQLQGHRVVEHLMLLTDGTYWLTWCKDSLLHVYLEYLSWDDGFVPVKYRTLERSQVMNPLFKVELDPSVVEVNKGRTAEEESAPLFQARDFLKHLFLTYWRQPCTDSSKFKPTENMVIR